MIEKEIATKIMFDFLNKAIQNNIENCEFHFTFFKGTSIQLQAESDKGDYIEVNYKSNNLPYISQNKVIDEFHELLKIIEQREQDG